MDIDDDKLDDFLDRYEYLLYATFSDYSLRAQFGREQWTLITWFQACSAIVNEDIGTLKTLVTSYGFDYMEVVRIAYQNALWRKDTQIAQFLERNGAKKGLVETVLVGSKSDIINAITTQRFEQIEIRYAYGALFRGRSCLIKKILPIMMEKCPIPIDSSTNSGNTLLYDVIILAPEYASTILKLGGNCDKASVRGSTPLITIAHKRDIALAKELLRQGASVHTQDDQGHTALICSILGRHDKMTELLLEAGSNVNILDKMGRSPLMLALLLGTPHAVRLLLQYGADKSFKYQGKPLIEVLENRESPYGKHLFRKLLSNHTSSGSA